jgi:hypothetical protein
MGWFFGRKKTEKTLEERATELLYSKMVPPIVPPISSPPDPRYFSEVAIRGIGKSETDVEGALERFKHNLDKEDLKGLIVLYTAPVRDKVTISGKEYALRISIIGYRPIKVDSELS